MSLPLLRYLVSQMLWLYETLIFVYALMSWFQGSGIARSIHDFLGIVCEPFVGLVRRFLPKQATGASGMDLSPLVAMLILIVLQNVVRIV